jgi:secreted PhoX family phosphatase
VPFAAEACGPLISDDDRTVFVAVQHPGETNDATFENPTSTWPHTHNFPRPGISCIWHRDGRRAGS